MNKELLNRRKARNSYRIKSRNKSKRCILNVFKSNKNIYAQIVDLSGNIKICISSKNKELTEEIANKNGVEIATIVGKELAKKAKKLDISNVVFNKGPYLYIGRIKSLAEAARENGLNF